MVRASGDENADLFWGLRGGGGNFGVVTGIDYTLYPVGPEIVGGLVAWPASEAPSVLELYRTLAEQAPPELTLITLMRPAPPAPWLPKVIEHAGKIPSPHSAVILFQLGGALNRLDEDHSPVGNRDAHYVFNIAGSSENSEEDSANIEWAREAWNDMKEFSTGGTYINFLTEDEGYERTNAALGKALKRLAEVKTKWDPQNVFRLNRNIKPG